MVHESIKKNLPCIDPFAGRLRTYLHRPKAAVHEKLVWQIGWLEEIVILADLMKCFGLHQLSFDELVVVLEGALSLSRLYFEG